MALAGIWSSSAFAAEMQRPNVVLMMAEDQGRGQVGCNGYPVLKTPHLDEMPAAGIWFDWFDAAGP
jgi:arylsulfatase A-like enzyme